MDLSEYAAYLQNVLGIDTSLEQITEAAVDIMNKHYASDIPAKKGMIKLIRREYEAGSKLVIFSASDTSSVEILLKRLEIYECFEGIYTVYDVGIGKSDKESYKKVARSAGMDISDTWVYEDILRGVRAAHNAGLNDVIGVTMQIWQDDAVETTENGCCGISAVDDARRVAGQLDIPYYVMNFKNEFKKSVIDYFVDEYKRGRTPNPCIACNRYVKWESLLKRSLDIGADYIATGHYARISQLDNGRYAIKNSVTAKKDQTYALYNLTQSQLAHTLMPVGDYTKDEIRKIAADNYLMVANKPDSMEICFVPDNDYAGYIERTTDYKSVPGNFVDVDGNVIGKHNGIIHYTVGQRKGLGLAMGHPVFVVAVRPDTNEVVIGENKDVFTDTLYAGNLNFMAIEALKEPMRARGKIRYSHEGADCTIRMIDDNTLECKFDEPQRAVTPGQALVLYDGEYVLGGGTII